MPEPLRCSKCNNIDEDDYLCEVTAVTQPGEEGYSEVTLLLCQSCLIPVLDGLRALGFVNHHHGSTDFLSDDDNCSYDSCVTPTGHKVIVPGGGFSNPEHKRLPNVQDGTLIKAFCKCGWTWEKEELGYEVQGKLYSSSANHAFMDHVRDPYLNEDW